MDATQVAVGVAAVVPVVQLIKMSGSLPRAWVLAVLALVSALVTGLLIYQAGGVVQEHALSYLTGFLTILTGASGTYGIAAAVTSAQVPVAYVAHPTTAPLETAPGTPVRSLADPTLTSGTIPPVPPPPAAGPRP